MKNAKKWLCLLLAVSLVTVFAACGSPAAKPAAEASEKTPAEPAAETPADAAEEKDAQASRKDLTFVLDWTPNTNHTGIYVALAKGYYEDAGLNVSIIQPPEDGATMMVASGKAQLGIDFQDYLTPVFASKDKIPVTAVAALIQHNTSGIISLKEDGIETPKGLEGKNYATWELPIEQAMLKNIVEADGGDFSKVNLIPEYITDVVSALKQNIDAVWIYYAWDGIAAERAGLDTNMIYFKAREKELDFVTDVDENIPDRLFGDVVRIRQVITNVLNNAVKYTDSGSITLKVYGRKTGRNADGKDIMELVIGVTDTGIGISEEDICKLFRKFERVDLQRNSTKEGAGLGLAISKMLLDMMKGSITCGVFCPELPIGLPSSNTSVPHSKACSCLWHVAQLIGRSGSPESRLS